MIRELGAAVAEGATDPARILATLAAILVAAKLFGELAERLKQPAVLGELAAGVLLGASALGVVDASSPIIHLLAELGVVILLFEIGLETDLSRLLRVGGAATAVAAVGVALPFLLGYVVASAFDVGTLPAIVAGAALTATSVGITARVLSDSGRLRTAEGQIILGAAVIDDIIGLVILAVVSGLVQGRAASVGSVLASAALAFGFVGAVLLLGRLLVPRAFDLVSRLGKREGLATMALALALGLAVLADMLGSALIVGAFAAGLVLSPTRHRQDIEHGVVSLGHFFVPIFFVAVGAAVDVRSFAEPRVLLIGLLLTAVAVAGKVAAGWAPIWFRGHKALIGVGMIPRGEVGLIFAQMGLTSGVLTADLFGALMMMVMVTTFLAPPLLRALSRRELRQPNDAAGGVAQLTTEA